MKNKLFLFFSFVTILSASGFCQNVSIGGLKGGDITKEQLSQITKLDADSSLRITGFLMTYMTKQELKDFRCMGPGFTPEMRELLKNMESGGKLFFEEIVATDKKGTIYKLPAMAFKIK